MKMWMSGLARFQFVRFALIGGINTAFSYGVYAGLLFTGINYAVSNLLALIAGIFFSFKTQGTYVFNNTNNRLLGRFVICWGMIYVINVLIIKVLMQFGLDPYTAGAVAIPPITILSYLSQKFFVFQRTTLSSDHSDAMGGSETIDATRNLK